MQFHSILSYFLKKKEKPIIVELGAGYGRVVLEIMKKLPNCIYIGIVQFPFTINVTEWNQLIYRDDHTEIMELIFRKINSLFNIFPPNEFERLQIPEMIYANLDGKKGMPYFLDNSVDLILSFGAIYLIDYPNLLCQEMYRVVKVGGICRCDHMENNTVRRLNGSIQYFWDYVKEKDFRKKFIILGGNFIMKISSDPILNFNLVQETPISEEIYKLYPGTKPLTPTDRNYLVWLRYNKVFQEVPVEQ